MVRDDRAQLCSTYRQIEIENHFWQTVFNNLGMSGRPIHIIFTVVDSMLLFDITSLQPSTDTGLAETGAPENAPKGWSKERKRCLNSQRNFRMIENSTAEVEI